MSRHGKGTYYKQGISRSDRIRKGKTKNHDRSFFYSDFSDFLTRARTYVRTVPGVRIAYKRIIRQPAADMRVLLWLSLLQSLYI